MKLSRLFLILGLVLAAFFTVARAQETEKQSPKTNPDLFALVRPDIFIVVREHPTGADLLEITLVDPDYPREVLKAQIQRLAESLKSTPRGLFVTDPRLPNYEGSIKATFGIDGVIEAGKYELTPLVRAFAGTPKPNDIKGMSVVFEKARPTAETVRDYRSDSVDVQADARPGSIGIEYRVSIKNQKPESIEIPDSALTSANRANQTQVSTGPDKTIYVLVLVAALAVGALVYSLTLRRPRRR